MVGRDQNIEISKARKKKKIQDQRRFNIKTYNNS